MTPFWTIHRSFRRFFEKYYPHILTLSLAIATSIGFLHYELKHNSDQLAHWMGSFLRFFNEMEGLILLPILLLITSVMMVFVIAINLGSMRVYDELTHLQMKKRYVDYLFVQLISRIEQVERKQLHSQEVISIKNIVRAHDDMRKIIDRFRMDTKKLLTLSEIELLPPPEEVFADDEIRTSRFAHLSPEENLVMELAAS